jgi:uncharacterized Zn-binding protein involved in type VI secretion
VPIPDNVLEKTGEVAGQATQNAAALQKDPHGHWYDVWSETGSGLADHARAGDAEYLASHLSPEAGAADAAYRTGEAIARDWHGTDLGGLKDGVSQQAQATWDQVKNLFHQGDPKEQPKGVLAHVGMAFGLLTSVEQLITMPLGLIPFPALPAIRVLDMAVGLPHAHNHPPNLTPPNPVPVPLPSVGPILPIPFVSGAGKVLINGLPAARCGDMGVGVWCGGYFPLFEVFLGSANVWVEGCRAGRVGVDVTKHCIFSSPKPKDPPMGPMFGTTINCSANVMIGGVPLPSLTSMAMGAAFKALFKGLGKAFGALRRLGSKAAGAEARFSHGIAVAAQADLKISQTAEELLQKLEQEGGRVHVEEVAVKDLADMTKKTGKEFGVALDKEGQLVVVQGEGRSVSFAKDDTILAHTHPHGPEHFPADVGLQPNKKFAPDSDLSKKAAAAEKNVADKGTEAVVYNDGSHSHFDETGPRYGEVPDSPISPDGKIDGKKYPNDKGVDPTRAPIDDMPETRR